MIRGILSIFLVGASTAAGWAHAAEPVAAVLEVTFLANEGVLLSAGNAAVVIDAFVAEPYSVYGSLSEADLGRLTRGEPPFENVRLALVSHEHRDHFQPKVAAAWLAAGTDRAVAASPQVLAAIRAIDADVATRLREEWPADGQSSTLDLGDVHVTSFRLSHGTEHLAAIQNLGHVIRIAGQQVLHIGDAEPIVAHFDSFSSILAEVDVALVPYWYWESEQGKELIGRFLSRAAQIAVHVPPGEAEEIRSRLGRSHPDVLVFHAAGDRRRFGAR